MKKSPKTIFFFAGLLVIALMGCATGPAGTAYDKQFTKPMDQQEFNSRLAPDLGAMLPGFPPLVYDDGLVSLRAVGESPLENNPPVLSLSQKTIPGPDGGGLELYIYDPLENRETPRPALLWIHGGGYIIGHPKTEHTMCELFVKAAGCVVVQLDYRLAPEYPYPAALEDCYAALTWMADNASTLNIDVNKIAIGGPSAGGGLTAALALLARDRKGPAIMFQMPLYPMIDDRSITVSSNQITEKILRAAWHKEINDFSWDQYLGTLDRNKLPIYAAPSRAEDLSGLPPAYICVADLDPFRDETIEYVMRLSQTGVPVEFHLFPGGVHGFDLLGLATEDGMRAVAEYTDALARAYKRY